MGQEAKIIQIPKPCHEKWSEMTTTEKGRFCKSCSKTLIDFSKMSDIQIANELKAKAGQLCGRFHPMQLNRPIVPFKKERSKMILKAASVAAALLITQVAHGQTTAISASQHMEQRSGAAQADEKINEVTGASGPLVIKGHVMDLEHNEPLIGVTIMLKGTEIGTMTDFDGSFEIELNDLSEDAVLEVSYTGYISKQIPLTQAVLAKPMMINLEQEHSDFMLMGVVVIFTPEQTLGQSLRSKFNNWRAIRKAIRKLKKEQKVIDASQAKVLTKDTKSMASEFKAEMSNVNLHRIYPNPFSNQLTIELSLAREEELFFQLYDVHGRFVYAKTVALKAGKQDYTMDLSAGQLTQSNYSLHILNEKGEQIVRQVIRMME